MTRQLNQGQAYILSSIAKWSDHYRMELERLNRSVQEGLEYGPRRGLNFDAATKANFACKLVDELLDQAFEMFTLSSGELSQLTSMAMKPTESGNRRRYHEGDEY